MNSAKEKKLNAIKSEILEITNFFSSNIEDENANIQSEKEIMIDSNDTLTLTDIVNSKHKVETKEDLVRAFRSCMSDAKGLLLDNKKKYVKILQDML